MECVRCGVKLDPEDEYKGIGNCIGRTGERPVCDSCLRRARVYVCCTCHRWWPALEMDTERTERADNYCLTCKTAQSPRAADAAVAAHGKLARQRAEILAAHGLMSHRARVRVMVSADTPPRPLMLRTNATTMDFGDVAATVIFEANVRVYYLTAPTAQHTLWVCTAESARPAHECIDWFRDPAWGDDVLFFIRQFH